MSNIWQRFSSIAGITSALVAVLINSAIAEQPSLNIDQIVSANTLPINTQVDFQNPGGIKNIITTATGNDSSAIDSILKAEGTANLSLINTNGIVFGSNATLQTGGSCLGNKAIIARINTDLQNCPGCVCTCWDEETETWVDCPCPW